MRKNLLTMLFAVGLLFVMLPIVTQAEDGGWCGQDVEWTLSEEGVLTISGEGDMYDFKYQSNPWRKHCDDIKEVKIESGVTSVEDGAFSGCGNLESVTLPEGMTKIEECAFLNCSSLTSLELPNSVIDIGVGAFMECNNLESIVLPQSITSIESSVFQRCQKLKNIAIPDSVTSIGSSAFYGCNVLEKIEIPKGVTSIGASAFCECYLLSGNIVIPEGVTKIGDQTFQACKKLESVEIPDSVTSIGKDAFLECQSLIKVNIPNGVTKIENRTFFGCIALESVNIPDSIISIGDSAFCNCKKIVDIEIPNNVKSIGKHAFSACAIASIVIPEGVTSIGESTFSGCGKLKSVVLPSGIAEIGKNAFQYCQSMEKIKIPVGITKIEEGTFSGCISLGNTEIPDGVVSIGEYAFYNCQKIKDIKIPDNVTSIGNFAFAACPITSIVIPEGVTNIGQQTFANCYDLQSVTLPAGITEIGEDAFLYCSNISKVSYFGTEKQRERISIKAGNDYLTKIDWEYTHQHTEMTDPAVEPTYFDEGKTEGSHCSTCGEVITEQQAVPKKVLAVPVLTASAAADRVKLAWNRIDGASGYEIFRGTQQTGSYSKIQTISGGNTVSFDDSGLPAGTTYYYKVRAVAATDGKTAYSGDSAIVSAELSEVIYTIKASAGKGGKADGGAAKKAGEKVTLKAAPDKGYYFAGWKENNKKVSSSQTYTFQAEKNRELTASFAKLTVPALATASADPASVKVSWKKTAGATGYEVYRADSKNGKYAKKAVISKSSTVNYTDKKLTAGKTYYYKVRAVAAGTVKTTYSGYSSVKSAKPLPSKVASVKASAGSKRVKLSWKKAAGVTGYEIYRANKKNGKYKKVKSIGKAASNNYTDKKLKAKKTYYYKIRAYKTVSGKKVYGAFSDVKGAAAKK